MLRKLSLILIMSMVCFIGAASVSDKVLAATGNSHYSLSGAEYQLYTDEACTLEAMDTDGNSAVLTTDADGSTNTLRMKPGTYYAKEVNASKGYRLDPEVHTVEVTEANTEYDPASFTSTEPPVYGVPEFIVFKTDPSKTIEFNKLTDAEFTVSYYDVESRSDIADATPTDWWKFKTVKKDAPEEAPAGTYWAGFDWQNDDPVSSSRPADAIFYKDDSGKRVLPLGWFTIDETRAPDGFKRTDRVCYGQIRQDENGDAVVEIDDAREDSRLHTKTLTFENVPVNTYVRKIDSATQGNITGVKLQVLKGSEVIDEWITAAGEHKIEGLSAGKYTLREISAPYGYDIADDVAFTASDTQDVHVAIRNTPVTLGTLAVDKSTGRHIGSISTSEIITDTVHMTGLQKGRKYKVTGRLMDKSTGKPVKGTGDKDVTASQEFTASAEEMNVTVTFHVDSSSFKAGTKVVVFETLQRTSKVHDETVPVELCRHEDLNDQAQTITYPGISTSASIRNENREVVDVISYDGLMPNERYVFRGWLVDTQTGEKVPGSDGSVALSNGEKTSGQTEMVLKTDGYDEIRGHRITAFEELYAVSKVDGKDTEVLIAFHRDRNDSNQIVEFYQDLKVQKNVTGNLGDLTKVFEYTVEFTGLVPGQAYTVEGYDSKVFNADPSGNATIPLKLKDDCEVIIKQLPKGAKYRITEAASDHVAEFKVFSEDMADKGAKIVLASGSNDEEAAKALSTALETVDLFDGTVVVLWENNRDLATITAVQSYIGIWACALIPVLAGLALLIKKHNQYIEE